jgi:hypothetical protein
MAGGFGYLFSLIHHTLFWYWEKYGIDYRGFLKDAMAHRWLRLVAYYRQNDNIAQKEDVDEAKVTRIMAWDVIALLWYQPGSAGDAKAPEMGETLVSRADAISDLMHSLGTSVIGAGFVYPAWLALYFWLCHEPLPTSWLVLLGYVLINFVLAVIFVWLHFSNFKRVRNYLVRLVKNALATHFATGERPSEPHEIFVERSALKSELCTTRSPLGRLGTALRQGFEKVSKRDSQANRP